MYKDNLYKLKVAAALAINVAADQIRPLEDTEHKLKTELSFVTRKLHQLRKDKDMYTKMHSTLAQLDKGAKLVGESKDAEIVRVIASGGKDISIVEWAKEVLTEGPK